jgi:hypothetical protein
VRKEEKQLNKPVSHSDPVLDDLIRQAYDEEFETWLRNRRPGADSCTLELQLARYCSSGWRPEWHPAGHPEHCEHCRRVVRVALRNTTPGLWILGEESQTDRPLWWKKAVEDYLATAPALIRSLRAAEASLKQIRTIDLSQTEAVFAGMRQRGERGVLERTLGSSTMTGALVGCLLVQIDDGRERRLRLQVTDWDVQSDREGRTVQVGVSGSETQLGTLKLTRDENGLLSGVVEFSNGSGEDTLKLLPPVLLSEEEAQEPEEESAEI